jgi:hypothetical protein
MTPVALSEAVADTDEDGVRETADACPTTVAKRSTWWVARWVTLRVSWRPQFRTPRKPSRTPVMVFVMTVSYHQTAG